MNRTGEGEEPSSPGVTGEAEHQFLSCPLSVAELELSCPRAEVLCQERGRCLPFCLPLACTCYRFRLAHASEEGRGRRLGGVGTPGYTWCLC